jgi:hypothetical protein
MCNLESLALMRGCVCLHAACCPQATDQDVYQRMVELNLHAGSSTQGIMFSALHFACASHRVGERLSSSLCVDAMGTCCHAV